MPNKTVLDEDNNVIELLSRDDYPATFDPSAYLKGFYRKCTLEPAISLILTLYPNIVSRLPHVSRLLDVGSGPTIHVPLYFRNIADEIYLSDFLPQNREVINQWLSGDNSKFDFSHVVKYIAMLEGNHTDQSINSNEWKTMENEGRLKVKDVLHCDVIQQDVLEPKLEFDFDIITTTFCLEYASYDSEQYQTAVKHVLSLLKPGGYFIMGGILEGILCKFGGIHYACHYLTKEELMTTLKTNGIDVDDSKSFRYLQHEDVFMLCGRKRC